jgi:RNA polymerase sigma factor (sigma-70 family)
MAMMSTGNVALRRLRRLVASLGEAAPDPELLQLYLERRDESAFAALLERHGPMVFGVCRSVLRHCHDAEEAFQATFLVLARRADSIRRRDRLGSWLHGVAYRVAQKARAAEARRRALQARGAIPSPVSADDLSWAEVRAILHAELGALPERFREPLVLCYLEGLRHDEAARRLGWSETTLKGRLQRGRELLRHRLVRRGLGLAALGTLELAEKAPAAAVSPLLAEATRRAVFAHLGDAATPASVLARGIAGPAAPSKIALAATFLFVTVAVAGGVILFPSQGAEGDPAIPSRPVVGPPKVRTDLYGDPLPEGALARLGTLRLRHAGLSTDFAILDGGKTVLTAGSDRKLRYWDVAAGKQIRSVSLQGTPRLGRGLTLSPDGMTLATTDGKHFVFWEVESGKQLKTIPQPAKEQVAFLYFSPDGATLTAGTWNPAVYLYEWKTGKERRLQLPPRQTGQDSTYHGHSSPDGKWLVAGGGFNSPLVVVELESGREAHRLMCKAYTSAVSPDSKRLAVASMRNDHGGRETVIRMFDLANGKEVAQFPQGIEESLYSLRFSPVGKALACGFSDKSRVLDLVTGRVRFHLPGRPISLEFTPDGKTLVGSTGKRLRLWDAATGKEFHSHPGEFGYDPAVAVSPDGRFLASADWMAQEVSLWDTATGKLLGLLPIKGEGRYVRNLAFAGDGKTLLAGLGVGGLLQVWDVPSGKERRTVPLLGPARPSPGQPFFYQFHPMADGKHVAALDRLFGASPLTRIGLWDARTGAVVSQQLLTGEVSQAVWSTDGEAVYVSLKEGLSKLDLRSGVVLFRFAGVSSGTPLRSSPDGRLLAARKAGAALGVWEAATGKEVTALPVAKADHFALAADNRTLVTTDEAFVRVWDLATGKEGLRRALPEVMTDATGKGFVHALALTPDGRRAITALNDGTALVWDLTPALRPAEPLARDVGEKGIPAWWADLAADDAGRAYAAVWRLSEAPAEAVALCRRHLKPVADADFKEARRHIKDLASETYKVRETAFARLKELGHPAAPAMRQALDNDPPLETRRRLEKLLAELPAAPLSPELLRQLRAVQVLERIASPDARRVLTELAGGMAHTPLTREARAALERLARR